MSGYLQKPGGGSSAGNPSSPLNGLQYNNGGVFGADALATRDPITNFTNIERDFNSSQTEYTADLLNVILLSNIVGSGFQVGETINNLTSGGTATVAFVGNPGGDLIYISNIVGTFTYLDNIVGITSGTAADVAVQFPISFSNGQTIYFFDTIANVSTGFGVITNYTGSTVTFTLSSGTVVNNYAILDNPSGPSTVAGLTNLVSSVIPIPMKTGFITDNNYAGAGLESTYMHIEDNSTGGSIDFGVFDLTPFGGLRTSAGIISLDLMSSASTTFIVNPAGASGNIQSNVTNANSDSTTVNISATSFSAITKLNPGQKTGFKADGTYATFLAGGYRFHMPTGTDTTGYVLGIQSQTGNDVYFGFQAPGGGGGGSSYGPNNTIQISDGGGNFTGNSSFGYDYTNNIPQFISNNGLKIDPTAEQYFIGDFATTGNTAFWYIDTSYGNNQTFFENTTHVVSTPIFTGSGLDNLSLLGTPFGLTTSYTVTIDSQLSYGGTMFTGAGLNDGVFSGTYLGTGNDEIKVVIDSTPVFSGITFTGAGLDDITEAVSPYFTGPLPTTYTLTITENNVKLLNYDTLAGGTFSDGDTITGLSSGTVATIIYQAGGALYYQVTSGTDFSVAETIDNGLGVTANVTSVAGIDADVFEWTDGVVTNKQWMLPSFYMSLNYGVSVTFASTTGHTIGDSWSFDYTAPVTDTFEWFLNGVSQASGVSITGSAQSLVDGISITFTSTTGHTLSEYWNTVIGYGYIQYSTNYEPNELTIGETVTGSISGATATVAYSDLGVSNKVALVGISTEFQQGETITGTTSGYTAVLNNFFSTPIGDTYSLSDGITTQTLKPVSTTYSFQTQTGNQIDWATNIGHTIGDYWTFTSTAVAARKLDIIGNNIKIGDVQGTFNYDRLNIDITSGINEMGSSGSFTFKNTYPGQGDRPLLKIVSGSDNLVTIGDRANSFNGFYSEMDMPNSLYEIKIGGISGTSLFTVDYLNKIYSFGQWFVTGQPYLKMDGNTGNVALSGTGQITIGDVTSAGNSTTLSVDDVTQLVKITNVPTFADDAAAATGGLTTGQLYKTTTGGITALNIVP